MPEPDPHHDQTIRETAYFIWEREGRPHGRDHDHWVRAASAGAAPPNGKSAAPHSRHDEHMEDEEKILDGRHDVNFPALLTKDVAGG
jgi:hypothetical protein